jgi:hypothetical protein
VDFPARQRGSHASVVYIAETPRVGLGTHRPPDYSKYSFSRVENISRTNQTQTMSLTETIHHHLSQVRRVRISKPLRGPDYAMGEHIPDRFCATDWSTKRSTLRVSASRLCLTSDILCPNSDRLLSLRTSSSTIWSKLGWFIRAVSRVKRLPGAA